MNRIHSRQHALSKFYLVDAQICCHHIHSLNSNSIQAQTRDKSSTTSIAPFSPTVLLRVCTVLYQQQNSAEKRLHASLDACRSELGCDLFTHELFLQVCNEFPYSWRPVYRFFQYTDSHSILCHTEISFNKLLDVVGKARNIELFWKLIQDMGQRRIANRKTFRIALKGFAESRELKKCLEVFHFMNSCGYEYDIGIFNDVTETLCRSRLVNEAQFVVNKMKDCIKLNAVTYKHLINGFCVVGNLIEASRIWNLMVDEGFDPHMDSFNKILDTLFEINYYDEALNLFQTMKENRMEDLNLSTYRLVVKWMCKSGKVSGAYAIFEEMNRRKIQPDNLTLASLVYGLLLRGRLREAYGVVESIEKPDIEVYHGLIKGLLNLRRAREATQVFREMIRKGCEPIMHTYIMLLQGHLGKKGRTGLDPLVNFENIFIGGLLKAEKFFEATKFVERAIENGAEVHRFDYNKFLHYYSNEEGVAFFVNVEKKLRDVGLVDLADIFDRYGAKMSTRERRRNRNLHI